MVRERYNNRYLYFKHNFHSHRPPRCKQRWIQHYLLCCIRNKSSHCNRVCTELQSINYIFTTYSPPSSNSISFNNNYSVCRLKYRIHHRWTNFKSNASNISALYFLTLRGDYYIDGRNCIQTLHVV